MVLPDGELSGVSLAVIGKVKTGGGRLDRGSAAWSEDREKGEKRSSSRSIKTVQTDNQLSRCNARELDFKNFASASGGGRAGRTKI